MWKQPRSLLAGIDGLELVELPEADWCCGSAGPSGLSREGLSDKSISGRHESSVWIAAEAVAGIRYKIARISLGRRIELARRIRDIARKLEFLEASGDAREKLEAAVLQGEIDRAYLEWGLEGLEGLEIDGDAATMETLIERGPLGLALEIVGKIRAECGLNEDERKN